MNGDFVYMDRFTAPDWSHAALLTIDMQQDFTLPGAPAEIPGTHDVVPSIQRLLHAFRRASNPIIHVVRLYLPDGSNVDRCRREAVEKGTLVAVRPGSDGAGLADGLQPSPGTRLDARKLLTGKLQQLGTSEWAMYKPRWGAFYQTPLQDHLDRLNITTLVICGCNWPNCPRTTMLEASERDYRLMLVTDAISGIYERAVDEMTNIGVMPLTTDHCLNGIAMAHDPELLI